jgi:hypothetical protein
LCGIYVFGTQSEVTDPPTHGFFQSIDVDLDGNVVALNDKG